MAENQSTYGDFIAVVEDTECGEAKSFIEEWKALVTESEWEEYRPLPLTPDLVINFAESMVIYFWERIAGIHTDALYARTIKRGHAFLQEVHEKAAKLGVPVELEQIDAPLTPSEVLVPGVYARNVTPQD